MIIVRIVRWTKLIGNGKELTEEMLEAIEEITMASGKVQAILEASRSSMGMDTSPIDLVNVETLSSCVVSLTNYSCIMH